MEYMVVGFLENLPVFILKMNPIDDSKHQPFWKMNTSKFSVKTYNLTRNALLIHQEAWYKQKVQHDRLNAYIRMASHDWQVADWLANPLYVKHLKGTKSNCIQHTISGSICFTMAFPLCESYGIYSQPYRMTWCLIFPTHEFLQNLLKFSKWYAD